MIVVSHTGSRGIFIFVVYLETVKGVPGPNCLKFMCMCWLIMYILKFTPRKKLRFKSLFNLLFNAIKAHFVAIFLFFCDSCFVY